MNTNLERFPRTVGDVYFNLTFRLPKLAAQEVRGKTQAEIETVAKQLLQRHYAAVVRKLGGSTDNLTPL